MISEKLEGGSAEQCYLRLYCIQDIQPCRFWWWDLILGAGEWCIYTACIEQPKESLIISF